MKTRIEVDLGKIVVDVDVADEKDIIEAAQRAVVAKLSESFPKAKFSKLNVDGLLYEDVYIGMLVRLNNGYDGIVTNKSDRGQKIHVQCVNGGSYSAHASVMVESDLTFEDVHKALEGVSKRGMGSSISYVSEGTTGYVKTREGFVPVVVGKVGKTNTKAYIVGNSNKLFKLSTADLDRVVRSEAKD